MRYGPLRPSIDEHADSGYGAPIITVKAARDQARAESIRDLVDAPEQRSSADVPSLQALAAQLETPARLGIPAHALVARDHRRGARDRLFSDFFDTDPAALRDAALALERLDARLVGLCVEHVLQSGDARLSVGESLQRRGSICVGTSPSWRKTLSQS